MENLRIFTAFSGYDSQCMALDMLGIDYELVGWSEIDRYAIDAHNAIYPQWSDRNYGDISKIDWDSVPDFDLFTYSFPCTDISNAGQRKGLAEDSGTRSSLLWECRKAIELKKPKYLLMENVKALISDKFLPFFLKWQNEMEKLGYSNFSQVLNAKDYGVPQNRERIFMVSILGDESYYFPQPFELKKRLKDMLDNNVNESYYLSKLCVNRISRNNSYKDFSVSKEGVAKTICASSYKLTSFDNYIYEGKNTIKKDEKYGNKRLQILVESGKINGNEVQFLDAYNQCVSKDVSGTIRTTIDSSGMHFISEPKISDDGAERLNDVSVEIEYKGHKLKEGDGLYLHNSEGFDNGPIEGISRTLKATKFDAAVVQNYRIRKLTERECFRLMGVSEDDIDKIQQAGISKTQQYKMAGNSIVVDVLFHIFRKLFIDKKNDNQQQTLF